MSMYEMVMGRNPASGYLLRLLDIKDVEALRPFGRIRDIWINKEADRIFILHRNYGNEGAAALAHAEKHPFFVANHSAPSDYTYAWFEFRVATEFEEVAKKLAEVTDTAHRWEAYLKVIDDMRNNKTTEYTEKAKAAMEKVFGAIESGKKGVISYGDGAVVVSEIPPEKPTKRKKGKKK